MTRYLWVALLASACTATIHRRTQEDVEGYLVASDSESVTVEIDGQLLQIPGDQIREINHPGDGLMLAGAILGGLALLATNSSGLGNEAASQYFGMIGLSLFVGGAVPWFQSTGAAEGFEAD